MKPSVDTLFIIAMAGVFLNLAYQQGSENEIVQRRAWEKQIEEELKCCQNHNTRQEH